MNASATVAGVDLPDGQPARVLHARPEPLRMKPGETALVVVDMQNAYASLGVIWTLPGSMSAVPGRLSSISTRLVPQRVQQASR